MHSNNPPSFSTASAKTEREELLTLIALQHIEHLGPVGTRKLLTAVTSAAALVKQQFDPESLNLINRRARKALAAFLRSPFNSVQWELAERTLTWLEKSGGRAIAQTDDNFPQLLRQLPDCPPFIYILGDKSKINKACISIVGARKPTVGGYNFAEQLGYELGQAGFTIVSGMAIGIDTAAHVGALKSVGGTIAVWATGADIAYPPSNRKLAERICQQGAIITEMPLGTTSRAENFPRRNRIVSGISAGVIVVEAGLPSGSLITANFAAEQNREVFAVPGYINNPLSKGCHQLLKDGATLVESAADVLEALQGIRTIQLPGVADKPCADSKALPSIPKQLQSVLDIIDEAPVPFEALANRLEIAVEELNMALIDLELLGVIRVEAGLYSLRHC